MIDSSMGNIRRATGSVERSLAPVVALVRRFFEHGGAQSSGYIAYSALIAFLPFTVFLVSLAGFAGQEDAAESAIAFLFDVFPREVAEVLAPAVEDVLTQRSGGLLSGSLLMTLWVASSGIESLRSSLNKAFEVPKARPFWLRRVQSAGFILVSTILVIAGAIALLADFVFKSADAKIPSYIAATVLMLAGLLSLYRWLPNVRLRWHDAAPGAVFAAVLWIAAAMLFSAFLHQVPEQSLIYGGLGGIIVLLMFFYVLAFAFVLGGELNALLWVHRRGRQVSKQKTDRVAERAAD